MTPQLHAAPPRTRKGAVTVLVAVCLTALIGVLALVLDGGILLDQRRLAQAAADAGALAAANELYVNYPYHEGLDPDGTSKARALASIEQNAGPKASAEINIPPSSGPQKGLPGYVEVVVEIQQKRAFSRIWSSDTLPVRARAVASGRWAAADAGLVVLEPKKKDALCVKKGSELIVEGDIVVNSKSGQAARVDGRSSAQGEEVYITGGYRGSLEGEIHTGEPPQPDPLRYVKEPVATDHGVLESPSSKKKGKQQHYELSPGRYTKELRFSNNDTVVMRPGLYYLDGCSLSLGKSATLIGEGVTIYSGGRHGKGIKFGGSSNVRLTAPSNGPYEGIAIFQGRSNKKTIKVHKGAELDIKGSIYAPNSKVHFKSATLGGEEGDDEEDEEEDENGDDEYAEVEDDGPAGQKSAGQIICRMLKADKGAYVHLRRGLAGRGRQLQMME